MTTLLCLSCLAAGFIIGRLWRRDRVRQISVRTLLEPGFDREVHHLEWN